MLINMVRITCSSDLMEILPEVQSGNRFYVVDNNEMNWSILSHPPPPATPYHHLPATRLMSISGLNVQQKLDLVC